MYNKYKSMIRLLTALALVLLLTLGESDRSARALRWLWQDEEAEETYAEVTLAPLPTATPEATETPTPAEAPEYVPVTSNITDDGLLRVYLKSLGDPVALDLTLDGVYTVDHSAGFRFERGAQISLSAEDGDVLLRAGGLWLDMGETLCLTRQAAEAGEANGIYIRQSEKDALYCGDLTVTAQADRLQAVLEIQIEDYLYGVVAYEMSDSFPLEALKAQAVAARTYAMSRKWVSAAKAYDVVDTTADQVYKGYDDAYTNVIRAVDETRGIVGTYKGGFAMCYYTASNGGQTALPTDIWSGDGDYGYLETRDDPYDLENPRSLVNSLRFTADLADSAEVYSLLEEHLNDAARAAGWNYEEMRIDRILAIEPTQPKREGSRMYERLRFALAVSGRSHVWQPSKQGETLISGKVKATGFGPLLGALLSERYALGLPYAWLPGSWETQKLDVELLVYDEIKDQLSLGLNGLDCELISVHTETNAAGEAEAFTLSLRRFGHGVGLSQRGAQQMAAAHDMDCYEILAFYYPGLRLERIVWPAVELTPLEALPVTAAAFGPQRTPKPTPAPLPALEAGEYYAVVTLASAGSTLNIREQPSTAARVLDAFAAGRELIVVEELDDGWARIRTAELAGYAKLEYLEKIGSPSQE